MAITSVRIENELESSLEKAAQVMQRPKSWIINEALRGYLMHLASEKQRWQDTLEALEDIRMGRVVDGDKAHAWLESWGTPHEHPHPSK